MLNTVASLYFLSSWSAQFFITTVKTRWLDSKHVIFGRVLDGIPVVKAIESLGTGSGRPSMTVTIVNCGVLEMEEDAVSE